jgi:hypothetical protein
MNAYERSIILDCLQEKGEEISLDATDPGLPAGDRAAAVARASEIFAIRARLMTEETNDGK